MADFLYNMSNDSASNRIRNASRVETLFGRWPSFHDAEIHRVTLDRGGSANTPSALFVVQIAEQFAANQSKMSALITLLFGDVTDLEMGYDDGTQNVVFDLTMTATDEGRTRVVFQSSFGLGAEFTCGAVDVVDVQSC